MEKDVVCGIQVDETTASNKSDYDGTTFHFCSPACKVKFDKRPEVYANSDARIRLHETSVVIPPVPKSKLR
jgi:YHS domain-containing protein